LSPSAAALKELAQPRETPLVRSGRRRLDVFLLAGITVALAATVAGIALTGVKLAYFLQPTGALIVLGGTLGVTLVTTPHHALFNAARHVFGLIWTRDSNRTDVIEKIVSYVKTARNKGLLAIEPMIPDVEDQFLRDALFHTLDVQRGGLQALLETKMRMCERQGETDAKVLEVAGGFAPTIGVLGTVVGLIEVLRQFSNVSAVAAGVGTAFVSTIYGLALANLILLPAAHRIRARVAETFELHELMIEGALCLAEGIHPSLVRERLNAFLREKQPG
jgi:chemotaxis protein MotA